MRCKKSDFTVNGFYHIFNHSVSDDQLFMDTSDYNYFINKILENAALKKCSIIAWCLMPNHFHFLIHQKDDFSAFKIFSSASMSYINHFNSKYERKGRLFNKLQHRLVNGRNDLLQVCTYIHLNPVKHGFVKEISNWNYSDYKNWIQSDKENPFRDEYFEITAEEYLEIVRIRIVNKDFS